MGTKLGLSKKMQIHFEGIMFKEDIWSRDTNGGWRNLHDKLGNKWIHTAGNITRINRSTTVKQTQHVHSMHEGHEKCLRNVVGKKNNVFGCSFSFYICTRSVDNHKSSCFSPHTYIHTHSSTVKFICRYRIGVPWVQNLLSYIARYSEFMCWK
jgi:hypothetical protein